MRRVRCNFVKMCIANSERYSGGPGSRVCTTALPDGPVAAPRAESHRLNGPGVQFGKGGKDSGLGNEDLRLGRLVQVTGRATLLPAAALVSNSASVRCSWLCLL